MDSKITDLISLELGAAVRRLNQSNVEEAKIPALLTDLWMDAIHALIHNANKARGLPRQTSPQYQSFRHASGEERERRAAQLGCSLEDFCAAAKRRASKPSLPPPPVAPSGVCHVLDDDDEGTSDPS